MSESLGSLKYHYLRKDDFLSGDDELNLLFTKSYELELREKEKEFDEFVNDDKILIEKQLYLFDYED